MRSNMFIDVEVDASVASNSESTRKLAEVCPVGIFDAAGGKLRIVDENLDECVLCDLCTQAFPGLVRVIKLYER